MFSLVRLFVSSLVICSFVSTVSGNLISGGDFENSSIVTENWVLKFADIDTAPGVAHTGVGALRSTITTELTEEGALSRASTFNVKVPSACPDNSKPILSLFYRTEGNEITGVVHVDKGFENFKVGPNGKMVVASSPTDASLTIDLPESTTYQQTKIDLSVFAGTQVNVVIEFLGADSTAALIVDDITLC